MAYLLKDQRRRVISIAPTKSNTAARHVSEATADVLDEVTIQPSTDEWQNLAKRSQPGPYQENDSAHS